MDNKEFDIYSFQMAIFSVVVGVALLSTNLTGLATFEIPDELLGLLGLSQAIFIGGKSVERSPFVELDQKLTSIRTHEQNYQGAAAKAASAPDDQTAIAQATSELALFKREVVDAAEMFWALYCDVLKVKPAALAKVDQMRPATAAGVLV